MAGATAATALMRGVLSIPAAGVVSCPRELRTVRDCFIATARMAECGELATNYGIAQSPLADVDLGRLAALEANVSVARMKLDHIEDLLTLAEAG